MHVLIESLQNERIKALRRLLDKKTERSRTELFAVEGVQENERAIRFGYQLVEVFVCGELYRGDIPVCSHTYYVSKKVYQSIAYRGGSQGIIGVYALVNTMLGDFLPGEKSLIVLLESVEKPGNLGAVLRTCEAFSVDALIVTDERINFYNPNVIRSSVGCLFGMNFFHAKNEEALDFFQGNAFQIVTTFMGREADSISDIDFGRRTVICFGTEHSGLSDFWINRGRNALIPTSGSIDSLNLSNAVAVCCYEFFRQSIRQKKSLP